MSEAVIVLAPVTDGRADALRRVLRALPTGDASLFARLDGTHVGRFTVLGSLDARPDRPGSRGRGAAHHLLLSAQVDPPPEEWLEALADRAGDEADRIWSHCPGYPGTGDRPALRRWLADRRVAPGFTVAPYPRACVAEIRAALGLRARLGAFAARASRLGAEDLRRAFDEELRP